MSETSLTAPEKVVHQSMTSFCEISSQNNLVAWSEESRFAIQALQKNSSLAKCAPHSIHNAIVNIAAVGLTLNPADGYAYLVPEYNKDSRQQECQLRISFKGLIKAATDTGAVQWVQAKIVRAGDKFTWTGVSTMPIHEMSPFGDRGNPVGVYCVAKISDNEYLCETMDWAEVQKVKNCAKTKMVWDKWEEEMAKKAVIKRAAKQWPKTPKSGALHKAVEVINESEGGFDPMADVERVADELLQLIEAGDLMGVGQIWCECEEKEQAALWTAKTKGGWFTATEKEFIRKASSGYKKAIAEDDAA